MNQKTTLVRANLAFKNRDFSNAVTLYKEAFAEANEPIKSRIGFNLKLAMRRLCSEEELEDLDTSPENGQYAYHVAPRYVPRMKLSTDPPNLAARVIAFYLPQFHPIPENDQWWGEGFTEWSNVRSAQQQFEGHYQPHVPDEFLGYYDLRDTTVMHKQIELAKQYGVEGFCFYTYWFSGHRLLETPVDNYLRDTALDLPFCICWANENWSRRWDGLDQDLLMVQNYSAEDDIAFIEHMSKYLRDSRYIHIEGKPIIIIYRPNLFPSMKETSERWRAWCRNNGIGEIYLAYVQSFEKVDPRIYGLDAAIEFSPNNSAPKDITSDVNKEFSGFSGKVFDWKTFLKRSESYSSENYTLYRGVCPSWDNTARKGHKSTIFVNSSPDLFEKTLTNVFMESRKCHQNPEKQIVFINAWNEWGEGCHLEPDQRYGYAWLSALRRAHHNTLVIEKNELQGKTLLFVDYAVPMYDRFAGSRTNFMYLKLCLKMGMNIIYLPADFKNVEPYSSELNALGVEVLAGDWIKDNWQQWFKDNGASIDYAFLHKPNPAVKFIEAILNYTKAPIVYQCHDLHYLRLQRQAELSNDPLLSEESGFFREKENFLFSVCDAILTFSCVEEEIIQRSFPQKQVHTVPLFFYDDAPKQKNDFSKRQNILYVGGFDHAPNRDAVLWFCHEVLPLIVRRVPDLVFNVVGANPPQEISKLNSYNVKIHGSVSDEELKALYDHVKLSVVPLKVGAGVKGKVIEALYHAVPLVSTSIGLEGIAGIEQLAKPHDDPEAFAEEVLNLYLNKNLWLRQSSLQADFVLNHFTVQNTADQMRKVFAGAKASAARRYDNETASLEKNSLCAIAFHLPQYHPIPENDEWWGKGFTEWRNVCKAKPLFAGHNQPHIPADLGFYDLRLAEARIAQADLAREYGIRGFCYYHYWFNGKRLLEQPVEEILSSGKPDFPFCLCWANENWTRRWDGKDTEILIEQIYSEEDDRTHIKDLFRFFRDPRYIRVNGKPLFLVYRTENMPDAAKTAAIWREEAFKAGIGELYLVRVESIGSVNPFEIGFDAAVEFAPDWERLGPVARSFTSFEKGAPEVIEIPDEVCSVNYTRSYFELMRNMIEKPKPLYPWFRCITPSWDNSARRSENAVILTGSSPQLYQEWLEAAVRATVVTNIPNERLVFINAWNEWAEGNHLEPCLKWGRAYLEATKLGIKNGIAALSDPSNQFSHYCNKLLINDEKSDKAIEVAALVKTGVSPCSLLVSLEEFYDLFGYSYFRGWAATNDDESTEISEVQFLIEAPDKTPRLIKPEKRKRTDVTAHFANNCNFDFSGFEAVVNKIDPSSKITILVERKGEIFWQVFK